MAVTQRALAEPSFTFSRGLGINSHFRANAYFRLQYSATIPQDRYAAALDGLESLLSLKLSIDNLTAIESLLRSQYS